jgi:hypothetical protein
MNIPARQHQACDFKATRREYEIPGARREMSAIERIDVERFDTICGRLKPDGGNVCV